jgi:hypothetical protein
MDDFIGDSKCVTHHLACDCREKHFEHLQTKNKILIAILREAEPIVRNTYRSDDIGPRSLPERIERILKRQDNRSDE